MAEDNEKRLNRNALILRELRQAGTVSVEALRDKLEVSLATVRRDLQELEDRGLLRRTHGGAIPIEPLFYEAFRHDRSFQEQVGSFAEEKRRIALAAAELISPGDTIALTAGTTTTEVVRSLPALGGLTVVTNTVNVAMELSNRRDIHVFVTGGHLRGDWFSLVGAAAVAAMSGVCNSGETRVMTSKPRKPASIRMNSDSTKGKGLAASLPSAAGAARSACFSCFSATPCDAFGVSGAPALVLSAGSPPTATVLVKKHSSANNSHRCMMKSWCFGGRE